jgi:hypothetical protein
MLGGDEGYRIEKVTSREGNGPPLMNAGLTTPPYIRKRAHTMA